MNGNHNFSLGLGPYRGGNAGLTVLGVIGAVAIMGIMVTVIAPPAIRMIDRAVAKSEEKHLDSFAEGLRRYIRIHKKIPVAASGQGLSWSEAIATEINYPLKAIKVNERGYRRRYLAHPDFFGDDNELPFSQVQDGPVASRPADPRIIMIGSTRYPLPLSPGSVTSSHFEEIWDTKPGEVPTSWDYQGDGDGLKIRRLHLGDMFHRLLLHKTPDAEGAFYSFGEPTSQPIELAPKGADQNWIERFVLEGSVLNLFEADQNNNRKLVSRDLIRYDTDCLFHEGGWNVGDGRGEISGSGDVNITYNITNYIDGDDTFPPPFQDGHPAKGQ